MSANKEDTNVEMSDATSPSKQCSPSKKQTDVATQAIMHLAQGKRNLIVQDIKSAVESLEKACSMFAEEFGETADECGESYYCYGSALLELARLETGVIGVGEGESTETSEDEQGDSEEDKEKESEPKTNGHAAPKQEESKDEADKEEGKDDAEMEETDEDKENDEPEGNDEEVEADPAEEEEIPNLQLAWEVLELAKNIFYRQSKTSIDMENKLSETYLKLGEVSLESENYVQSIEDLCQCLFIRQKNLPSDDRKIAEVHYQLGNSYSFDKQYMKGKFQYDLSLKVLNERIDKLKEAIAARVDGKQAPVSEKADAFYTEEGEIEEIEKILPEIAEKIADMEDLEKEVKVSAAKILEFGEGSSGSGSSSSSSMVVNEAFASPTKTSPTAAKSATNISHLVKRKRESTNSEGDSPKAKAAVVEKKVKVLTNGTTNGNVVNGDAH